MHNPRNDTSAVVRATAAFLRPSLSVALFFVIMPVLSYSQTDPFFSIDSRIQTSEELKWHFNGRLFDFDSDGDLDFLAHGFEWDPPRPVPMVVFRNDGSGGFSEATEEAFDGKEPEIISPDPYELADFNGDGLMDYFIADAGPDNGAYENAHVGGQSRILMQTARGQLRDETGIRLPEQLALTHSSTLGDIDGDSDVDIYMCNIGNRGGPSIGPRFYINDGSGFFSADTTRIPETLTSMTRLYKSCLLLDVDKDADLDLVLGGVDGNFGLHLSTERDAILLNDGQGVFKFAPEASMPPRFGGPEYGTVTMASSDFDNDGWPDLLMSTDRQDFTMGEFYSTSAIQLLMNNGDGSFRDATERLPQPLPPIPYWFGRLMPGDFNSDGWTDFVAQSKFKPGRPLLLYGRGEGEFVNARDIHPVLDELMEYKEGILPGDLDNDGDIDFLMYQYPDLFVLRNLKPVDVNSFQMPSISGFSPGSGAENTEVTISGTNLSDVTSVWFNGESAEFVVNSGTQITATVPVGVTTGAIRVTSERASDASKDVFSVPGPTIFTLSDTGGPAGASVAITGQRFNGATAVTFNGIRAEFTVISDEKIIAFVPAGETTGPIRVTTTAGTGSSPSAFAFQVAPPDQTHVLSFAGSFRATAEASASLNLGNAFTMEAWRFRDVKLEAGRMISLLYNPEESSGLEYILGPGFWTDKASLGFTERNAQPGSYASASIYPYVNCLHRWDHVAGTLEDNTLRLYVNGVEVGRASSMGPAPEGPAELTLGGLPGALRRVRLWNRALTGTELQQFSQQELTGSEDGLVACWPLDEGQGQTLHDLGPNGIHLTLGTSPDIEENEPIWVETNSVLPPPLIESLYRSAGSEGSAVSINGANFGRVSAVEYNDAPVDFTVKSSFHISVTVPEGASPGVARVTTSSGEAISDLPIAPTPDFNGNGTVDIMDFFLFADAFGGVDPVFDINEDGEVSIYDFFVFADQFGRTVGKDVAGNSLPHKPGKLTLERVPGSSTLVLALRAEEMTVRGYDASVEYDASSFHLVEVTDAETDMATDGASLLMTAEAAGQVRLAGSRTGTSPGVRGVLARLRFEPLAPEAEGLFRLHSATVRRPDGSLVWPRHLGEVSARLLPEVFVLLANYPNPFNPSTTIRYSLPVESAAQLQVFDILGQKVRTVVRMASQPAGIHVSQWDGRDDGGAPVASGIYFYRLEAQATGAAEGREFTAVRKLMLLR